MGVNGFARIIDKEQHLETMDISAFKGQRLAIDMYNLVYRLYPGAKREVVRTTDFSVTVEVDDALVQKTALEQILRYLGLFLKEGVEVICCFDSRNHPKKQATLEKRKVQKEKPKEKLQELKERMCNLQPLERHLLIPEYQKLLVNSNNIPFTFWDLLLETVSNTGYPCYKAEDFYGKGQNGDGEALVATFCINGYCQAGVTNDTDFHMYGGSVAIVETHTIAGQITFQVRRLSKILDSLKCNYQNFLDACIIGGTDYSEGLPRVALKTGLKKLSQVGWDVYNLPTLEGVDYEEVLAIIRSAQIKIDPPQLDFDHQRYGGIGEETLKFHGLDRLMKLYRGLQTKTLDESELVIGLEVMNLI